MSLIEDARRGVVTEEMRIVAAAEGVTEDFVRRGVAEGHIVIPVSPYRRVKICGIGEGLRTKVNASIGTSTDMVDVDMEVEKVRQAERAGADTLMELSTGGDFLEIRRRVVEATTLSVGSVPLYQAFIEAARKRGAVVHMEPDDLFRITAEQAKLGTNFMAIHTGINYETMKRLQNQGRHGGLVSRGGAFMTAWMLHNEKENPLYSEFDYLLEILKEHEVTLSFGNGMRAGAVHDATDRAQVQELLINAELADKAHEQGVQTIIEGPGHIPVDEIQTNVVLQKRVTNRRPFYMLGPLVTDIAPGYDDRVAAIGAALSSSYGADFICYVTPAEHLALPTPEEVYEGVMSSRIAAHVGDMIKLKKRDADLEMGHARRDLDWERQFAVAMNPERARAIRDERMPADTDGCTMCGDYCALKIVGRHFNF
ncbi:MULTISPECIES: phosphomethylpyrimidine synthase ThiC [Methanoculleus]|uniref:Phosphomethylpyrimidine synthase n=2 Tax=Methanoculleus TaxID=45989 RepID=THIC_METMJ|nr:MULTISPECIES: phosphomethylpyrimidine synthase ThiC [Methanoculleus]A3CVT7.1 RecName: Full=Phosphomethylpyrimidine synthase; AltName: Full=Hydroxymethylpyrimidine phosphate synthase; Short=HMP-P synthase; Short=HMP-phosphate synthase; Short=HMPP synthase; AltName: Full=Thiamine biosynthesis protein ThiC [Methanoculleus marisnigri JR1]ABN57487.1 hydroxymethylpyrimidine synthase [Methanoculleus marisnigri JR1]MCC7555750.1 phosphomethylpyrimidine synthase ThiC [Methanoculleus marisnigri]UYU1889